MTPKGRRAEPSRAELDAVDAWWRAANYLSVGQIYLRTNPLLREPLGPEHIKARLLGHFGTVPGLNLVWVHANRQIVARELEAVFVAGPGHGGPGPNACAWLEGTYSELYSDIPQPGRWARSGRRHSWRLRQPRRRRAHRRPRGHPTHRRRGRRGRHPRGRPAGVPGQRTRPRCFHCKDELFTRIGAEVVAAHRFDAVAYGENATTPAGQTVPAPAPLSRSGSCDHMPTPD